MSDNGEALPEEHTGQTLPARATPQPRRGLLAMLLTTKLDKSTRRIRLIAGGFALVYCIIGGKLIYFAMHPELRQVHEAASDTVAAARPDILDRNGAVLATDIKVTSVFAEPRRIIDRDEAIDQLTNIFPDLNVRELTAKLNSHKGFVWIKRAVTPAEQQAVYHLGLPGIGFTQENKRVYPNGPIAAHVLGFANLDGVGISGLEKYIDSQGLSALQSAGFNLTSTNLKPIVTSLDLNATYALRDEVAKGVEKFKAKAGAGAILDVNTGEVIAMASLPDFDPNNPVDALRPQNIDRMTVGVYEMGSTFKAMTLAMAFDAGKVTLNSKVDARESLRYGRFTIHDFEPQHRVLSVPECFTYSSNICLARIAMMVGVDGHKAFLRKMGQLTRLRTELPESAAPLVPRNWSELNTMTIAFGQGLNVAPLQALMAVGALANGGTMINPTFLKRSEAEAKLDAPRVIKPESSETLRYLMRLNAEIGTAKNANIDGYFAGGKTGTAQKIVHGHYSNDKVLTTFMAIVPADKPKYLFFVMLDEPQAIPGTYGFHTAAWNSGAIAGKVITRVGPLLGLEPRFTPPSQPFPLLAQLGYTAANSAVVLGSH